METVDDLRRQLEAMTAEREVQVTAERAAVVAYLRQRAADQSNAARHADTGSQRRVKQAQARSALGAAEAIERGEHLGGDS